MARIRTIKPEFWQNEELSEVCETARLVAIGILNLSDDEGWFKAHARLIESALFPLTEPSVNIHECLNQLINIGYISLHIGSDGKQYGNVVNFTKHQKVNRPSKSKIKDLIDFTENSMSSHGALTVGKEQGTGKGTGNREQGKEDDLPAKPEYSQTDYDLAEWMLSLITAEQPDFKKPDLKKWAKTIRLMRERDGRDHRSMAELWKWARNDDFWKGNILSADKFRKQYDQLTAQASRKKPESADDRRQRMKEERNRELGISQEPNQGDFIDGEVTSRD